MIQFGDITVSRKGDTYQYKKGKRVLVEWSIERQNLIRYDFCFPRNWKDDTKTFSFIGDVSVDVDMKSGIHAFRFKENEFQVRLAESSTEQNEMNHLTVYRCEGDGPNEVKSRIYDGGATITSDYNWTPEGKGTLSCTLGKREGVMDGEFHEGECTGTWSSTDDDTDVQRLSGTFECVEQQWKPQLNSVMRSYSYSFLSDTNSCIYVVRDCGDDGYFCVEESFVLKGTRKEGHFNGEYTAFQPRDLAAFLKEVDKSDHCHISKVKESTIGMQFSVTYDNDKLISVKDYEETVGGKKRKISYQDHHRTVTIDSVNYEDDSSLNLDSIFDVACSFSINEREGYQEKEEGIRIIGLWDSNSVKGRIMFPNEVQAKGVFYRNTMLPQGECAFFKNNEELFQLEYDDPFVVFKWEENGYQFRGEYLLSLWNSIFSDPSNEKDADLEGSWLSFLSTIANNGISFSRRYENVTVSHGNEKWKEMTLFKRDYLCDKCEEFLEDRCDDCYYSRRILRLLDRTSGALMNLKYGRKDPIVPEWATSYYPHGSASYIGNVLFPDIKETYYFYGKETILEAEKEEGGTRLGNLMIYQLTHPRNEIEENLNDARSSKRYEMYSVCRRGFRSERKSKHRSPFEDDQDFEVFRGSGEIVDGKFIMVKGKVRVIIGEYVLSMDYERMDNPETQVYTLVEERMENDENDENDDGYFYYIEEEKKEKREEKSESSIIYKGYLEFEHGIPIRCSGKGCLTIGEVKYDGFFTKKEILCCRVYVTDCLQFCGTVSIKTMTSLCGFIPSINSIGGDGRYWKISDDWKTITIEDPDMLVNDACPLFNHRFIYVLEENQSDPYVLVVGRCDKVYYDLSNKTITFADTNVIHYKCLKSFSLPNCP